VLACPAIVILTLTLTLTGPARSTAAGAQPEVGCAAGVLRKIGL